VSSPAGVVPQGEGGRTAVDEVEEQGAKVERGAGREK
jgi:hypothetical protein